MELLNETCKASIMAFSNPDLDHLSAIAKNKGLTFEGLIFEIVRDYLEDIEREIPAVPFSRH